MPEFQIHEGDCEEVLGNLAADSVDSIVTDPPAGVSFMGNDWDGDMGGRDQWISWLTGTFEQAYRVLKPGGYILVWALPRTAHWTATAIENAGFSIRDRLTDFVSADSRMQAFINSLDVSQLDAFARCASDESVVHHLFGSGFPKSKNVGKAIDHAAGAKSGAQSNEDSEEDLDTPVMLTIPEARRVGGQGTALKPAVEHWILAQKRRRKVSYTEFHEATGWTRWYTANGPVQWTGHADDKAWLKSRCCKLCAKYALAFFTEAAEGGKVRRWIEELKWTAVTATDYGGWVLTGDSNTQHVEQSAHKPGYIDNVAAGVLVDGVGGLNIDGCRIGEDTPQETQSETAQNTLGRWPAHLVLEHHPDCVCTGSQQVQAPTINRWDTGAHPFGNAAGKPYTSSVGGSITEATWECAKGCPIRCLDEQTGALKSGVMKAGQPRRGSQGLGGYGDGFPNTATLVDTRGDAGGASRFFSQFQIESEPFFYTAKASPSEKQGGCDDTYTDQRDPTRTPGLPGSDNPYNRGGKPKPNFHPTVKPLRLMQFLVRLVTPSQGTVLDLFMGSGSTGMAALLEGRNFVGIEKDPRYFKIAQNRLENTRTPVEFVFRDAFQGTESD